VTLRNKQRDVLGSWGSSAVSIDADTHVWMLAPYIADNTAAAVYYVEVDGTFFMKDGKYLSDASNMMVVTGNAATEPEGFELAVTPAAGKIDKLDGITIEGADTEIAINWNNSTLVVTLSRDGETIQSYDLNTVNAGDQWPDAVAYKLEANYTDEGVYTLNIPAGAFLDADGKNESAETTVVWTIGDESSITSISVTSNGKTTVYDLSGRRVATPAKGLYIVNGVKTILK
jgi:hypothetical protein